jgi:hypothetical protein
MADFKSFRRVSRFGSLASKKKTGHNAHYPLEQSEHPQITGLNAFQAFPGAKMENVIQARK